MMAVGASVTEAQRVRHLPKVTQGVSVGTWLDNDVMALSHHMTLLRGDSGRVRGTPETMAELLGHSCH